MTDLRRELGRKTFHMLCLGFSVLLHWKGWPTAGRWTAWWLLLVLAVEAARLSFPEIDRQLMRLFGGMIRDSERRHLSGVAHSTAGCLGAMVIADGALRVADAAIFQLAFADAAAALAGKRWGRTRLFGGQKSLEGSLAGLAAGFAAAWAAGVPPGPAALSALAASLVEAAPTTARINDNLWMPVASAAVLRLCGVA